MGWADGDVFACAELVCSLCLCAACALSFFSASPHTILPLAQFLLTCILSPFPTPHSQGQRARGWPRRPSDWLPWPLLLCCATASLGRLRSMGSRSCPSACASTTPPSLACPVARTTSRRAGSMCVTVVASVGTETYVPPSTLPCWPSRSTDFGDSDRCMRCCAIWPVQLRSRTRPNRGGSAGHPRAQAAPAITMCSPQKHKRTQRRLLAPSLLCIRTRPPKGPERAHKRPIWRLFLRFRMPRCLPLCGGALGRVGPTHP